MVLATLGVNCYFTSRLKIMFDYAFVREDHGANDANLQIMEGRVQYES